MSRALTIALLALLLTAGTASAQDAQPTPLPAAPGAEAEPNDTAEVATEIVSGERIRASVFPANDVDYYRFTAEAGDLVFATATTNASASASSDSRLRLLGPDGTTVVERDDDDGSLGSLSSSIAGAEIPAAGAYYLEVRHFSATQTLRPYDLWLEVQSGEPAVESEANDAPESAGSLSGGFAAGSRGAGDQDWYALELGAGDTVFLSLDLDPERDGTAFNGRIGFGPADSLAVVDDNGATDQGIPEDVDSEAYVATVSAAGTYYVRVDSGGAEEGAYRLSATVIPAVERSCRTYAIEPQGAIPDQGEATFPIQVADAATIDRVAVALEIDHAFMADLDVTLQAPAGNQIGLFTDIGNNATGGPTLLRALFDDDAAAAPHAASHVSAALQPEINSRLSYLAGQQAAGTWNLTVRDDVARDVGTLARAELILCARPEEGPVETVFAAGFEDGEDGFTHSGTADEWEHGTPATPADGRLAGLESCGERERCFKTDLDGTYDGVSSQDLVSPPISLAGRTGRIYASWRMWYQLRSANVQHATVSVEEEGGGDARPLFTWLGADMVETVGSPPPTTVPVAAGWDVHRADISRYAGRTIRLRFHLDSDAGQELRGLAIDDVRVYQPAFDLDLAIAGAGGGYVDSTPAGIDCGSDASAHPDCTVTTSGEVTLTAHPDADSSFAGFTGGGCSGPATSCTVTLDQARSVTATFDLLHAPVAEGDAYASQEDTPLSVDAPGVLGNDTDLDGDPLTAALESRPQHGTLLLEADGSFTYTPDADFNGGDSFSYRASDGGLESEPATVTIDVSAVDDPTPATPPATAPPTPPATTPPTAPAVVEPAISDLRLGSRCVRRSASGRVRMPMTMRLAQPRAIVVSIDRAVGSRTRRTCPRQNRTRDYDSRFRPVTTVRPRTEAAAAAVARRVTLRLRLKPGLYRIGVRVQLENGRLSRPVHAFLRVVG